ncbi:MAG: endonuclease [Bacteroidetes bacterium]|nr:MAG: endonuclease [Bacteroidota bacterium]
MSYKVFVLYSHKHDKLYVGYTESLTDYMVTMNVMESNNPLYAYRPWTLIHMELFFAEEEAMIREGFLKRDIGQQYIRSEILPMFDFQ